MSTNLEILRDYRGVTRKESLSFSSNWSVELCPMKGSDIDGLTAAQIKNAIYNPIGASRLREIAEGKKDAVIVFDDISRPTRIKEIVPFIIKELIGGGISKENISFVCSLGAHGAHSAIDFRKKLGKKIVQEFRVYNHNPFMNCDYVGETSLGTRVEINKELMKADVKIGIGSVVPHPIVGFSGCGKVFFPGMASIRSIKDNHLAITKHAAKEVLFWQAQDNMFRNDIDEAVKLINVDFSVDALMNDRGQTIAVFAGNYRHYAGLAMEKAEIFYHTAKIRKKKVIILNAFLKASEAFSAILLGTLNLKESGGALILIIDSPPGQVVHYLTGSFGKHNKGPLNFKQKTPRNLKKIIIVSKHISKSDEDWLPEPAEGVVWVNDISCAIKEVEEIFPEEDIDAAIFPNATIQYYPDTRVLF
jgi:hypothetical protein